MKIRLICIGAISSKEILSLVEYMQWRLSKWCDFSYIELKSEAKLDNITEEGINKTKELEGNKLLDYYNPNNYSIFLDANGEMFSSKEFAKKIKSLENCKKTIDFFIGGTFGYSEKIMSIANDKLSISKMTFTHTTTRYLLLEQIYRAFTINNNYPYDF